MPILLDCSPFFDRPTELIFRGQRIPIRSDQIILWLTLTPRSVASPTATASPFPVILDTGHTHTFSIRRSHLIEWAGIRPESLPSRRRVRDRGLTLMLHSAHIWCHPNRRGEFDSLKVIAPHHLEAPIGIAVYPDSFPRLPILGLKAISDNKLTLRIDGRRRQATLRTTANWWPFF